MNPVTDTSSDAAGASKARFSARGLLVLAACAIGVRVLTIVIAFNIAGSDAVFKTGDSMEYLSLATGLANDGRYETTTGPDIRRVPGYAVALVPGVWMGHAVVWGLALNIALNALVVCLVVALTQRLSRDGRAAWLAGAACALEPGLVFWSLQLMSELVFTAVLTLGVLACLNYLDTGGRRWLIAAAVLAAAGAYTRLVGYFVAFTMVPFLAMARVTPGSGRRRLANACVYAALCVVMLVPWHVRNGLATGYWGFSAQMDRAVFILAGGSVLAASEDRPVEEVRKRLRRELQAMTVSPEVGAAEAYQRARRTGLQLAASQPFTYLGIHLRSSLWTLLDPGTPMVLELLQISPRGSGAGETLLRRGVLAAIPLLRAIDPRVAFWAAVLGTVNLVLLSLAAVAVWRWRQAGGFAVLLMTWVIAWCVLFGGAIGHSRYRAPIVPLLCVLAAQGYCLLVPSRT